MKRLIILLIPILSFAQNRIEIHASTNVSKLTCTNYKPIVQNIQNNTANVAIPQLIYLNIKDFDCNNKKMTRDFREMLDMENHPVITITNQPINWIHSNTFQAIARVEINGKQKNYLINLENKDQSWNMVKTINLSDFNLKPPTILGGLIYVKDEISIQMHLQNNMKNNLLKL